MNKKLTKKNAFLILLSLVLGILFVYYTGLINYSTSDARKVSSIGSKSANYGEINKGLPLNYHTLVHAKDTASSCTETQSSNIGGLSIPSLCVPRQIYSESINWPFAVLDALIMTALLFFISKQLFSSKKLTSKNG